MWMFCGTRLEQQQPVAVAAWVQTGRSLICLKCNTRMWILCRFSCRIQLNCDSLLPYFWWWWSTPWRTFWLNVWGEGAWHDIILQVHHVPGFAVAHLVLDHMAVALQALARLLILLHFWFYSQTCNYHNLRSALYDRGRCRIVLFNFRSVVGGLRKC